MLLQHTYASQGPKKNIGYEPVCSSRLPWENVFIHSLFNDTTITNSYHIALNDWRIINWKVIKLRWRPEIYLWDRGKPQKPSGQSAHQVRFNQGHPKYRLDT
jgi:hypothetical protein